MSGAPPYSKQHVKNCAFAAWYPSLQHVSIKSVVIPLPEAFVSLLLADGVKLSDVNTKHQPASTASTSNDATKVATENAVAEVREQVEQALRTFKHKVFVKTNWSSPRDATWMLGTMQCTNFDDIFLLLKASDFIVHDLTEPYAGCSLSSEEEAGGEPSHIDAQKKEQELRASTPSSVYLVVKKWCNFFDSMHFRCFVVNHQLVGICQRNCDEYYPFLMDQQDHLCHVIDAFYEKHFVEDKQEPTKSCFSDSEFIFDVYVDKKHRVYLLDINVFGAVTDTLLFSWEELLAWRDAGRINCADTDAGIEFRVVESEQTIRPNPMSSYRTPTDFVDHLAGGAGFEAFLEQVKRDNTAQDSSSDEDNDDQDDDDDDVVWGSDNDD